MSAPDADERVGAIVGTLAEAVCDCGHKAMSHDHGGCWECRCPHSDMRALAPAVARLMAQAAEEAVAERLADAWEKGAYDGREYQKLLLAYRGPFGMGRHPMHPPNPYRAAVHPKETDRG